MYLQKVISRTIVLKISFLLASWRSMTKIAGSGSISQRRGSADPDPFQKCHRSGTLLYSRSFSRFRHFMLEVLFEGFGMRVTGIIDHFYFPKILTFALNWKPVNFWLKIAKFSYSWIARRPYFVIFVTINVPYLLFIWGGTYGFGRGSMKLDTALYVVGNLENCAIAHVQVSPPPPPGPTRRLSCQ